MMIAIDIAYALPEQQYLITLQLEEGVTALEAVEQSDLLKVHPELAKETLTLGIYGRKISYDQPLIDGDRIEIYRPLAKDPMTARRDRAKNQAN